MKILIADESPQIRKLIIEILGSEGNQFVECSESSQILPTYTSFHPNLVIVDFELAGMDYLTLKDKYPRSKIIMTSDYSEHDILEKENGKSINGFVMKENLLVLKDIINN